MPRSFLFILLILCLAGCSTKRSFLEKYYTDNPGMHRELRDSLMAFCKLYDKKVYIRKNPATSNDINFYIFFNDIPGYTPIVYDSALQRRDYNSSRTSEFVLPKGLMENFKRSIYLFITCDDGKVFFGYKEDGQQIFAREVYYVGILTPSVGEVSEKQKRISPDAIITTHYLP